MLHRSTAQQRTYSAAAPRNIVDRTPFSIVKTTPPYSEPATMVWRDFHTENFLPGVKTVRNKKVVGR
jgi:hypothetical protein